MADLQVPRHVYGDPEEIHATASAMIRDHLCEVWGWLPEEAEAHILAEQLATGLFAAVVNTGTQPLSLLEALLHPRPSEFQRGADVIVTREK